MTPLVLCGTTKWNRVRSGGKAAGFTKSPEVQRRMQRFPLIVGPLYAMHISTMTYRVGQNKHGCVRSPMGVFTRIHVHRTLLPRTPIASPLLLLLLLLSSLHDTLEFPTEGVNMAEVEGAEVREEMLVHVLICPAKRLFSSATTVVVVAALLVCRQSRLRWWRPETFWKANEVQATVMIDLYSVLGKSAVQVSIWRLDYYCR